MPDNQHRELYKQYKSTPHRATEKFKANSVAFRHQHHPPIPKRTKFIKNIAFNHF